MLLGILHIVMIALGEATDEAVGIDCLCVDLHCFRHICHRVSMKISNSIIISPAVKSIKGRSSPIIPPPFKTHPNKLKQNISTRSQIIQPNSSILSAIMHAAFTTFILGSLSLLTHAFHSNIDLSGITAPLSKRYKPGFCGVQCVDHPLKASLCCWLIPSSTISVIQYQLHEKKSDFFV